MSDWLLFFHVIGAVGWFGGHIYIEGLFAVAGRSGDPATVAATRMQVIKTNDRLFAVFPLLALIFGMWLVIEQWGVDGFQDFWVAASFVLTLVALAIGIFVFGPRTKRYRELYAEQTTEEGELATLGKDIAMWAHISTAIVFVVFVLMIFQPTF